MTDDDNNARPFIQIIFEGTQCVEIEVVGRLVEQQNVGLFDQCQQKLQSSTLATRQCRDRRVLRITVKPKLAHQLIVFNRWLTFVTGNCFAHALIYIQFAPELVVVTNLHCAADI